MKWNILCDYVCRQIFGRRNQTTTFVFLQTIEVKTRQGGRKTEEWIIVETPHGRETRKNWKTEEWNNRRILWNLFLLESRVKWVAGKSDRLTEPLTIQQLILSDFPAGICKCHKNVPFFILPFFNSSVFPPVGFLQFFRFSVLSYF